MKDFLSQKTGKIYPILLILFIFLMFFANAFKASALRDESFDSAPLYIPENIEKKEPVQAKKTTIAKNFASETQKTVSVPTFRVTKYIASCTSANCFVDENAQNGVVQYKTTFFYGHSTLAFNDLKTRYVGDLLQIVDKNGTTHTYQVKQRIVKSKAYLNGDGKNDGFTSNMYGAKYLGQKYSISLMTCGNGANNDGNYRLILFADEV